MKIEKNVNIGEFLSFGVGGHAPFLIRVFGKDELLEALKYCKDSRHEFCLIAGGSNIVFADGTSDLCVIKIESPKIYDGGMAHIGSRPRGGLVAGAEEFLRREGDCKIWCRSDVLLADLVRFTVDHGLAGLETLSGIPGTVGGAIVGNAGAYGHSIGEVIQWVNIFDGEQERIVDVELCDFRYRHSVFKDKSWFVLDALFVLEKSGKDELIKKSEEIIKIRENKYRPELKCPGSYFKNVLVGDLSRDSLSLVDSEKIIDGKVPAGYLLELVGAKGMREGGISVSDFHGNLLVNTGGATFEDVIKLANRLKVLVKDNFKIDLEEEVRIIDR